MGLKWLLFLTSPLLLGYKSKELVRDGWFIDTKAIAIFPHMVWSSYKYFIHYQRGDSCAR